MGLIDNFGRVASMYMEEKENLQKAEEKRKKKEAEKLYTRILRRYDYN